MTDVELGTVSGRVLGTRADGIVRFLGVPYALAPEGERLTRAPISVPRWDGVRDARRPGSSPPQPRLAAFDFDEPATSGSYLNVNVFTPEPGAHRRPVLVWLCVGGNVIGSNNWPTYDATVLARRGIVVVTVNARLGPAGFTLLDDAPDNRAALDWVAALEWVRAEIESYGGDPTAITVAGQSAGAGATAALLTSSRANGLFQRAIVMSAATPSIDPDLAREASRQFMTSLGVEPSAAGLASVPADRLIAATAERFGPAWRVADAVQRVRNMLVGPPFRLVRDSASGIDDVLDASQAGAGRSIAVLAGHTAEEFTAEFDRIGSALDDAGLAAAMAELGLDASAVEHYRRRHPDLSRGGLLGQAYTDGVFRLSTERFALAREVGGGVTFGYEVGPFPAAGSAAHGVDVPLVFGTTAVSRRALDYAPLDGGPHNDGPHNDGGHAIRDAWVRFVTTGDPGWEPYGERRTLRRFTVSGAASQPDALAWERATWPSDPPFVSPPDRPR